MSKRDRIGSDQRAPSAARPRGLTRREWLRLAAAAGIGGFAWPSASAHAQQRSVAPQDRKLLFVFCAMGGASIIDSFLPIVDTEVGDPALAATLNVYPEALVEQLPRSNIRSVRLLDDYRFFSPPSPMGRLIERHGQDMIVVTHEGTTVNHSVGQQRALNGNGINRGRTLMEEMALQFGGGLALPSCNMAADGYLRHGSDASVPPEARHEVISAPQLFATGTHGYRAIPGVPDASRIAQARAVRDRLDRGSAFGQTFAGSPRLARYLASRGLVESSLEPAGLLEKLLLIDASRLDASLGVQPSAMSTELRQRFPNMDDDSAQAQLALGFLLTYHGVSASAVMGLRVDPVLHGNDIVGAPIAFDYSHTAHTVTQSVMWGRTAALLDTFITLLKTHDYLGDPALGKMWDRSLVYVATEFGRDKRRPPGAVRWGTGHHLNNGSILLSPLLKGNAVYGGVDPQTGLTYGFDPISGAPDRNRTLAEGDVYSLIAHALGLDFPGRRAFDSVVRNA